MTTKKSRRFQSSREVFETYIPNYTPPAAQLDEDEDLTLERGSDLATSLLNMFKQSLHQTGTSKTKSQSSH